MRIAAIPGIRALGASDDAGSARPLLPNPILWIALIAAYVGLDWLSFLHEHNGLPVTPWNPGLGLMLGMIILHGAHYGVLFFIGFVLAELLVLRSNLSWPAVLTSGFIVAVSYTCVATLARGYLRLSTTHVQTRDLLVLGAAGLVGAVTTSTLLCLLLLLIRQFHVNDIAPTIMPLVLGDLIGIAVVTPLILRSYLHRARLRGLSRAVIVEFTGYLLVILALVTMLVRSDSHFGHTVFYVLFMPVIVAAVRHGIDGACATLAIAQLTLVGVLHLHGLDLVRFTEYQLLMLVLTLTALLVGSVVSERNHAEELARETAVKLHDMQLEAARIARLNLVSGTAAALAHEINQPITAARALARSVGTLLTAKHVDLVRAAQNVNNMIEQIDHAGAVIKRMREFLRRRELHVSTVSVPEVLAESAALIMPLLNAHQIKLDVRVPEKMPNVFADRVQIQQVILNLVRNAVDAIAESGRVSGKILLGAQLGKGGREVEVLVRDNGPGIPVDRVDRIFEPMSTTRVEGVGLGLSICKTIVQAHGGRIWLQRTDSGQTEFRFALPLGEEGAVTASGSGQ
jgi:signal transduction histidine kinase